MADEEEYYEPDIISVSDEDGNEILFELLERYETDNDIYVAITRYYAVWPCLQCAEILRSGIQH